MLLLASQHIVRTDLHVQGPPPTVVEWMILPWVLGESKGAGAMANCLLALSKEITSIGSWASHELGHLPSVQWESPLLGVSEIRFLHP